MPAACGDWEQVWVGEVGDGDDSEAWEQGANIMFCFRKQKSAARGCSHAACPVQPRYAKEAAS